jgi:hypothetical protein
MRTFREVWRAKWGRVLGYFLLVWGIESFAYFAVATWAGAMHGGVAAAWNLQLPVDRLIPWFTPIFALYIPLPFIWILLWPFMAWQAGGERLLWRYFCVSLWVYGISTVIYALWPTVTIPHDFLTGPIQTLPKESLFYAQIAQLDSSSVNVFGSMPSFHNVWAAFAVGFGIVALRAGKRWRGWLMIGFGLLITLSTFLLHQHAIMDAVLTYLLVGGCWWLDDRVGWSKKLAR